MSKAAPVSRNCWTAAAKTSRREMLPDEGGELFIEVVEQDPQLVIVGGVSGTSLIATVIVWSSAPAPLVARTMTRSLV